MLFSSATITGRPEKLSFRELPLSSSASVFMAFPLYETSISNLSVLFVRFFVKYSPKQSAP